LEATIESLQTQLHEQEAEANYAITQWQDEYTVAEDKCAGLESELQALKEKQNAQGETSQNQLEELLAQKQAELKDAQQMMESSTVSIQVMKGTSQMRTQGPLIVFQVETFLIHDFVFRPNFKSAVNSGKKGSRCSNICRSIKRAA
jgi:aryl carrier-like protein